MLSKKLGTDNVDFFSCKYFGSLSVYVSCVLFKNDLLHEKNYLDC